MDRKVLVLAIVIVAAIVLAGVGTAWYLADEDEGGTVSYINLPPGQMDGWLATNQSDAYIAWEPFVSSAVVGGTGRVLEWTSEIMPNHPCCVVVVSTNLLSTAQGPEIAQRFVKAHLDATLWIQNALAHPDGTNYTELVNMSVKFTARSEAVVEEGLSHVTYGYEMSSSFISALEQFTDMYIETNSITNETLELRGYSDVSEFVNDYVDESYIAAASSIAPSASIINPSDPVRLGYLAGDLHQIAQVVALNESAFGGQSLFEKYGLNVEPQTPFLNGGLVMDAMISESVDIGYLGAPPAILKRVNLNAPAVIVAQANSEGSGLVVSVDSDIHNLGDLVGRTVATPGETSIQHLLLKIALQRENIAFVKA